MKKVFNIIAVIIFVLTSTNLKADTLIVSLKEAYTNNSKLNAERASVRATYQDKNLAISEFMPNITVSGYASEQDNTSDHGADSNFYPSEQSLLIEQKIFDGFGGVANYKKQKYEYKLSQIKLKKNEQETLLDAAEAHTDFILGRKKLNINRINVDLLERQVETDQARLERGEISLTDLAQSEASLAGAEAKLISAENELVTSTANFERIIGISPSENIKDFEKINFMLPQSLAEAIKISSDENPDIQIASTEYEISKQDVFIAGSEFSPSATLSYKIAEQDDFSASSEQRVQQTLKAEATWPLYAGSSNYFGLKKAKELRNRYNLLLEDEKKALKSNTANAWSNYQSSKSVLESVNLQVRAAEIANEGIIAEYESGSERTTLEVIQSSSVLLDSRIDLAIAEKNFLISQLNLLSSIGRLTARHLNLK